MMRKFILFILASFFMFNLSFALDEKKEDIEWDFGKVKQGTVLSHDFILKNESNDILTINSVHTSCGCTVSKAEKESLLPQSSTKIKAQFNTRGYFGQVRQHVYVNTDSADQPIIKFTLKADVVKEGQ